MRGDYTSDVTSNSIVNHVATIGQRVMSEKDTAHKCIYVTRVSSKRALLACQDMHFGLSIKAQQQDLMTLTNAISLNFR